MSTYVWSCHLCDAPTDPDKPQTSTLGIYAEKDAKHVHPECLAALSEGDSAGLERRRAEACAAGHHRSPGKWSPDPDDPYGDAVFWVCVKGCGHVQRHPGYGTGKALVELGLTEVSSPSGGEH